MSLEAGNMQIGLNSAKSSDLGAGLHVSFGAFGAYIGFMLYNVLFEFIVFL